MVADLSRQFLSRRHENTARWRKTGPVSFTIRPATVADAEQIAEVHVATWRAAYRGLLPQALLDGLTVASRADGWRRILSSDASMTLVAVDEATGRVVGFVGVGRSRDDDAGATVGELHAIYLHPDQWGRGIGRALHDAGLQALAGDFMEATLWVLSGNDQARAFYERQGWRPDGHTKDDERGDVILSEVRYRRGLDERRIG